VTAPQGAPSALRLTLLFARARKPLPLDRWDEAQLERYAGDAAALEPLRAAIAAAGAKVEQETIQRRLYALLD
jgi:hypothetical protein